MTATQKVLRELIQLRLGNNSFPISQSHHAQNRWISGGFRPLWHFQRADCGGTSAGRQIRRLRLEHNVPIEMKRHKWIDSNGINRNTPIYRIGLTIKEAGEYNWLEAFQMPFNWVFKGRSQTIVSYDENGQGIWI